MRKENQDLKLPEPDDVIIDFTSNGPIIIYEKGEDDLERTLVGYMAEENELFTAYFGPQANGNLLIRPVKDRNVMIENLEKHRWYILDWARHGFLDHEKRDRFYRSLEPYKSGQKI